MTFRVKEDLYVPRLLLAYGAHVDNMTLTGESFVAYNAISETNYSPDNGLTNYYRFGEGDNMIVYTTQSMPSEALTILIEETENKEDSGRLATIFNSSDYDLHIAIDSVEATKKVIAPLSTLQLILIDNNWQILSYYDPAGMDHAMADAA